MTTTPQQAGAELALPSDAPPPPTLSSRIAGLEAQFATAAPRGMEAQQIVRDALTLLAKTPRLGECEPSSVLGGLMTLAQLGLRPGVLGHAWLIPFYNKRARWLQAMPDGSARERVGRHEAQLVIGYQGLVTLAYRSGIVDKITARTVRAADHFRLEYGLNERLEHIPARVDRGDPVGYYATVKIRGAGEPMFYYMTHDEMLLYRQRYAMARDRSGKVIGPWRDEFESMALKTCVRQLSKYVPKGTDLATALAADDTVRIDLTPTADVVHVSHHIERDAAEETLHVDLGDIDEPPADEVH
jgi:recombination protein RecT